MHLQGSLEYAGQLEVLMHLLLPSISLSGAGIPTGGASPRQGELVGLQIAALQALREFILYRCAPHVLKHALVQGRASRHSSGRFNVAALVY